MNELSQLANLELILDNKLKAKFLFWLGWKIVDIAEALDENERTVQAWKTREEWEKTRSESRVEEALTVRLMTLTLKNKKSSGDYKELGELFKNYKEFARIERYKEGGNEADLNPNIAKRNAAPKKKKKIISLLRNKLNNLYQLLKIAYLTINAIGIKQVINVLE